MRKHRHIGQLVRLCIIFILIVGIIYSGLQIMESTVLHKNEVVQPQTTSKIQVYHGVEYYPRQDITTVLIMGIGENGPAVSSGSYRNSGEADALFLLVLDETNRSYTIVCLNRDTMVEMPVLGVSGSNAGYAYCQLALAHTYGDGLEVSCENTVQTVSDMLHGMPIDYYVSVHMDGIAVINDAVGGVTVRVEDDFSAVDPTLVMGQEIKLNGEQALHFVQSRMNVGNQLNLSRMDRHKTYMEGLRYSIDVQLAQNETFALDLYNEVGDYIVTNCSASTFSSILDRCSAYTCAGIITVPGDNVRGEEYYEFYLDEEAFDEVIFELLYAPKN